MVDGGCGWGLPGQDNWDRYQYVWNNPVNFVDPTGDAACLKRAFSLVTFGIGYMLGGFVGGMVLTAGFGVVGNYTGGGGSCSTRLPDNKVALLLFGWALGQNDRERYVNAWAMSEYYENTVKGNAPSFLGRLSKTEFQIATLMMYDSMSKDSDPNNDLLPLMIYNFMWDKVAPDQFGVDKASFYHDQFGPSVLNVRNRRANSRWIAQANRETFSSDSWARTSKREYKATSKRWGDARRGVATLNAAGTWMAEAAITITGTVLFGIANMLTGTKNLGNPKKWKL